MASGWILDVEPVEKGARILLVDENRDVHTVTLPITYRGYIKPLEADPEKLAEEIQGLPGVVDAWIENWFIPPYYRVEKEVVVYEATSMETYKKIKHTTIRRGAGIIVNDYPDPLVEALWRNNIIPSTRVEITGRGIEVLEDMNTVDYDNPPFTMIDIEVYRLPYRETAVVEVDGEKTRIDLHELPHMLSDTRAHIGFIDPADKIYLDQRFPGLLDRAAFFWMNKNALLVGLNGLIEWSRISYTPIRLLDSASIGSVLTTIEALEARRRKYLVVKGHGRIEKPRDMRLFIQHDRGGTVYTPRSGVYWNVCQVDYSSLYPSIIMKYNISGETVEDPGCTEWVEAPGTGHRICVERRGIVASTMELLVPRKERMREKLMGRTRIDGKILEERMKAVKWILVASFGYLGYRNSLFGSITAHEAVTGIDRYITMKARRILAENGYQVIHVLVDSLFVYRGDGRIDCDKVCRLIEEETGFKARIESEYTWLVFPVSSRGFGYSNRYYGRLVNGELKVKGLYTVRRDTPPLIKKAQWEALETLASADTPGRLLEAARQTLRVYEKYKRLIETGKAPIEELAITRRIHKQTSSRNSPVRRISLRLGYTPLQLKYVVAPGKVYVALEEWPETYDKKYYLELLKKAYREILAPINKDLLLGL